jgi:nicotinate dehydrogenase subunit A
MQRMTLTLSLTVNGRSHEIEADPAMPLLLVLRNHLGLTGAKLGCGLEQCGACAVLVDGEVALSCNAAAADFQGRDIVTVEGLARDGVLNAVQRAFVEAGAAQCGYCVPGMVIAATALFEGNPRPTDDEISDALATQLCRCGTQARILTALRALRDG